MNEVSGHVSRRVLIVTARKVTSSMHLLHLLIFRFILDALLCHNNLIVQLSAASTLLRRTSANGVRPLLYV